MTNLTYEALGVAISQIGQKEDPLGSNWGHPVQDYLESVGINFPASWCMAFVYWCFDQAAMDLKMKNPLFKTGGVLNQYNMSRKYQSPVPQAGDIFIMDFGKGLGHTGFVETVNGGVLNTIEGNSNNDGSRNGVAVVRHVRNLADKKIKGYLRF